MKTLTEHIIESIEPCNEGRSNPESITTSIKKWIMEFSQEPHDCYNYALDFANALYVGVTRGVHEFEKKVEKNEQYDKAIELLKSIQDSLSEYSKTK